MSLLSLHVEDIIVPHILPYLSLDDAWQLRTVCKQLYYAVYDYYATQLTVIKVRYNDGVCPGIYTILRCAHKLKYLDIVGSDSEYDTRLLVSLTQSPVPPSLTCLTLSSIYMSCDNHMIVNQLAEYCRYLSVFEVQHIKGMTDKLLEALLQHCHSLTTLSITSCGVSHALLKILPRQHNLKHLKLEDCLMNVRHEELSRVLRFKYLEVLILKCLVPVNDRTLETVCEFCPQLRRVGVDLCPNVNSLNALQSMRERGVVINSRIPPGPPQYGLVHYQI